MIIKHELMKLAKRKQLNGALVDEYILESDDKIKLVDSYTFDYRMKNNVIITRSEEEIEVDLDDNSLDIDYSFYMNKNDQSTMFARSNLNIFMRKTAYRTIPFTIFDPSDKEDETPKIGDGKHMCSVMDIHFMSKIYFNEGKYDLYNDYISFALGADECYIFCINYTDGTLPTILISKNELFRSDIERIIFDTSTDESVYNSYYHPHQFKQVVEKSFPDVVFGSPGGNLKGLTFNEKKVNFKDYENTDGVYGLYNNDTGIITVKFSDHIIAEYTEGDQNQYDIDSIIMCNIYKNSFYYTGIPNKRAISEKDLLCKYNCLSRTNIRNGENIEYNVYDEYKDDLGTYYDSKGDGELSVIHVSPDEKFIEVINFFERKHDSITNTDFTYLKKLQQYMAFDLEKNLIYSICVTINEDTDLECFINCTNNRIINVSRDTNNIMYDTGKFWITCNKNNDVINTNMGIDGQIVPYNIFGIPVEF